MKVVWLFLFFIVTPLLANQKTVLVLNAPFNTPNEDIYITGAHHTLCNWNPNCLKLNKIHKNVFEIELDLNEKIQFKITRGSWDTQAATPTARSLKNSILIPGQENILTVKNWKDMPALGPVGEIHKYDNFYSPQLDNKRSIHVWLPPTYRIIENKNYPVLYFHDGQNAFDPKYASFAVDWAIDDIAQNMTNKKMLNEFIIVAIFSKNRNNEYNHNKLGKKYADFLVDTLKPFIDTKYRTLSNRKSTFTMGSSMGALISFSILWTYPHIFSRAAGLSLPAFAYDEFIFDVVRNNPVPIQKIRFYMDHGTHGQDANYLPSAQRFFDLLKNTNHAFEYKVFPFADHTETDWARRLSVPLNFLMTTGL